MELAWTPLALVGLAAAAVDLALAAFLMHVRSEASVNRRLAAYLTVSALTGIAFTSRLLLVDARDAYAMVVVFMVLVALGGVTICALLATIPSPLAAPFRARGALVIAGGAAALVVALIILREDLFLPSLRPFAHVPGWEFINGPAWQALSSFTVLFSLYGLAIAVDAWRRAPRGIAGRRAGTFALGFGLASAIQALSSLYLISLGRLDDPAATYLNFIAVPIASLVFAAIVAYGILRFQLFDIDVRIKRGLRRGTLAALFVAVFFAATEVAQIVFQEQVGAYVGVLAAAALAFALHPLQRLADRVAETAMPHVTATPQYLAYRRLEIYRETYEGLVADGSVTPKERSALDRLRATLGILEADAAALEAQVDDVRRRSASSA